MEFTLYHYVHCPYCIRVRLAAGYLGLSYQSQVLPYHDEKTPMELTGVKMLPIATWPGGKVQNESLDIIASLDVHQKLPREGLDLPAMEEYLNRLGGPVHSLCMPYWIWTPEFSPEARQYFQMKKEKKRGPFKALVSRQEEFIQQLCPMLDEIEEQLEPFYASPDVTLKDLMLAAHLWGLYLVPEFQFSPTLHQYLQEIKKICRFNYHADFWK